MKWEKPVKQAATEISEMVGKSFGLVQQERDEILYFIHHGGGGFRFFHDQSCCENVYIEEIIGDLNDLIDTPIITAEKRTEDHYDEWGSCIYTFYEFATIKGSVTIRWMGSSNGYYSMSVDIEQLFTPTDLIAHKLRTSNNPSRMENYYER